MTQSGWKITLEIITDYRGGCQDGFYCEGDKNVCGISLSAIRKTNAEEFSFLFFFLPL